MWRSPTPHAALHGPQQSVGSLSGSGFVFPALSTVSIVVGSSDAPVMVVPAVATLPLDMELSVDEYTCKIVVVSGTLKSAGDRLRMFCAIELVDAASCTEIVDIACDVVVVDEDDDDDVLVIVFVAEVVAFVVAVTVPPVAVSDKGDCDIVEVVVLACSVVLTASCCAAVVHTGVAVALKVFIAVMEVEVLASVSACVPVDEAADVMVLVFISVVLALLVVVLETEGTGVLVLVDIIFVICVTGGSDIVAVSEGACSVV